MHLEHFGPHYAVVLRALGAHCIIVYATSTWHKHLAEECEEVWPDSAEGRRLGLDAVTYFYARNCIPVRSAKLELIRGRCPLPLVLKLRLRCQDLLASLETLHSAELDELAVKASLR